MTRRFRHCWLVITGQIDIEFSTERMELKMALEKTLAAAATLQSTAQALIAKSASDEAALAQAQSDLANADDQASAAIQPTIDALKAAVPPAQDGSAQ